MHAYTDIQNNSEGTDKKLMMAAALREANYVSGGHETFLCLPFI